MIINFFLLRHREENKMNKAVKRAIPCFIETFKMLW